MTQQELAEKVGLSRPYLTQIEKGQRRLNAEMQRDIAAALGVKAVELVDFDAPDEIDEEALLSAFRSLSEEGRREWLQMAKILRDRKS